MEPQLFEDYAPVIVRLLQHLLRQVPAGPSVDEYALAALGAVQRAGAAGLSHWLREVIGEVLGEDLEVRLRAAIRDTEPSRERTGEHAAWSELRAAAEPPGEPPGPEVAGLEEQRVALHNFVLGGGDRDPEELLAAIGARLHADPMLLRRLRTVGFGAAFLRELVDYASLVLPADAAPRSVEFDAMLSYCRDDRVEVLAIFGALEERALRVWLDQNEMFGGNRVIWQLCEMIDLIRRYVVCCGKTLGRFQRFEVENMVDRTIRDPKPTPGPPRRIIPVVLAGVPPGVQPIPQVLQTFLALDLREDPFHACIDRLQRALREV